MDEQVNEKVNENYEKLKGFYEKHDSKLNILAGVFLGFALSSYYSKLTKIPAKRVNRLLADSFYETQGNFRNPDGTYTILQFGRKP
jgi:hypothetical protein